MTTSAGVPAITAPDEHSPERVRHPSTPVSRRPGAEVFLVTLGLAALIELFLALVSLLWSGQPWWRVALRPGLLYAGLGGTLAGAIRLRLDGGGWRRLAVEALAGVRTVVAVAAAICLSDVVLGMLASPVAPGRTLESSIEGAVQTMLLGTFGAALSALLYAPARAVRLAWVAWGRLRRRRVLWSLTHAQLVVTLVVAAGLATLITVRDFHSRAMMGVSVPSNGTGDAGDALGQVLNRVAVAAGTLVITSSILIPVIVVPATLISVFVLRRATRRLEHLTTATAALRAGDLSARVPVGGEDEVARLQGDFNAMAADLEGAMDALRAERDTVARLLQARRELVASVSHELRTPVATLRAYLDAALAGSLADAPPGSPSGQAVVETSNGPPPALRQDLEVMAREAVRLQRLIEDLFALSRAEAGRLPLSLEAVDTGPLLERCAAAAAPLAWERGRVEVLAGPPARPLWALADPGRLEQVVRNLVANAVRHTPPGGVVLLTATPGGADAPGGGLPGDTPGEVVVQVKDTGEGIPAADLPRIWERFYRGAHTRGLDSGAGLGLALVKELTEAMGGAVTVQSTPGAGSVFSVRLPAAQNRA